MKTPTRHLVAAAAALALAGCAGGEPTAVQEGAPGPIRRDGEPDWRYTFFKWQVPVTTVAVDTAMEYGIRFKTSLPGVVVGFRVYHVEGDTSRVTFALRNYSAIALRRDTLPGRMATSPDSSHWQDEHLAPSAYYRLTPEIWYRVSAHSRGKLGKTTDYFAGGAVVNRILTADQGFSILRSSPWTTAWSNDAWFVDVIFQPDPV